MFRPSNVKSTRPINDPNNLGKGVSVGGLGLSGTTMSLQNNTQNAESIIKNLKAKRGLQPLIGTASRNLSTAPNATYQPKSSLANTLGITGQRNILFSNNQ